MIKSIVINNRKIKISVVKKIPDEDKRTLGCWFPGMRRIYIRKRQNKDEMNRTLLHEIWHAYLWTLGLHNLVNLKTEEVLCDTFSNLFIELTKNKKIINLIRGK